MATDAALSPSTCHRRLVTAAPPAQRWDGDEFGPWRRKLRTTVAACTGFKRMAAMERCPLKIRHLWRREVEGGTLEKIRFTVEPGCDAVAYLCLPAGMQGEMPWMVCVQGHTSGMHHSVGLELEDDSKPMAVEGDRDFGLQCLRQGIPALCLEQRGFGERREWKVGNTGQKTTCYDASCHAMMLGRSLIAERVYDLDRALDYLWTRADVDRTRVGVMGNSGGGTTSLFGAALLKRLAFAMPSCYFCTFDASIMNIHHCLDNYVPGLLPEAEMGDILGTFAPKPVVVVAGKQDDIFPIKAVRSEFRHLQRIYAEAGAADKLKLVVGPEGHRFYADAAWKAARPLFGI